MADPIQQHKIPGSVIYWNKRIQQEEPLVEQAKDKLTVQYHPVNLPGKWSQLSYAGEKRVPQGIDPSAGSWSLFYLRREKEGVFTTLGGQAVSFSIKPPDNYDFNQELTTVKNVLDNLTDEQKQIAIYWGEGPPTKQWTPIIDRLIDTYGLSPVHAARVLAAVQGGINDALVVCWFYKYIWDVPRPNQLDQELATYICTPRFPTYPSGHSVMSGTSQMILSYFFPPEARHLKEIAEEVSISRLYGGVHFPADLSEGLRLGRQIGSIVVDVLKGQHDKNQSTIDTPANMDLHAELPPPPYKQVIPFPSRTRKCDLPLIP